MSKVENKQFEFNIPPEDQEIPKVSYETEIVTVYPEPRADTVSGASLDNYGRVQLDWDGEIMTWSAYIDDKVDATRKMVLTIVYFRLDAGGDTIAGNCSVYAITTDGNSDQDTVLDDSTPWIACALGKTQKMIYELDETKLETEDYLVGQFQMLEEGKDIRISTISLRYFVRSTLE